MKKGLIIFSFLIGCFQSYLCAQSSKIYFRNKKELSNNSVSDFFYEPAKGTAQPQILKAKLAYNHKGYITKTFVMDKLIGRYIFSFAIPNSTDIILISILNEKGDVFDNNADKGFIVYPLKNGNRFSTAGITKVDLLNGFADYFLKLKYQNDEVVKMFEEEFLKQPALKKGDYYLSYLYLSYKVYPQKTTAGLLSFAKQKESKNTNESDLEKALRIYKFLKKEHESKTLGDRIIREFPKGEMAKKFFWKNYYSVENRMDSVIDAGMGQYRQQFGDIDPEANDRFLMDIITNSVSENDSIKTEKTEKLVKNKTSLANMYNSLAWDIVNNRAETKKLNIARLLSEHSLLFINDRITHPLEDDDSDYFLLRLDNFMDTYAFILFKTGEYDSAFLYQDSILKRGNLNVEGKERYALFAEKAKGLLFTMQFIETEVQNEGISQAMLKQLEDIYKQLNIPAEKYSEVRLQADVQKKRNTAKMIKDRFGLTPPKNFQLKDLKGRQVSLSDFKDKVVVLDFWATWCGPCRASFPQTQEIVKQYKNDKKVIFLFIDTWEDKNLSIIRKNAAAVIKKNNYDFRILIDDKNEVAKIFKVDAIPATFILDKKHNIVYMGEPSERLGSEIEAARTD